MTRPNRARTAARPSPTAPPSPTAAVPLPRPSGSQRAEQPTPRQRRAGRRRPSRWVLFLAALSVSCLALAVWSFGRATHRADTRLPVPEVVDGAVPVVWEGTVLNFTTLGKIAGPGQEYLVADPTTAGDGAQRVLRLEIGLDHAADSWGGWMFTHGYFPGPGAPGRLDWGAHPRSGYDLSGATALTVVARGAQGGERLQVFTAGQGYDPTSGLATADYRDSTNKVGQTVTLTDQLATYTVDLRGQDMSYVGNGLGIAVAATDNADAQTVVVELADVRFEVPDAARTVASRADHAERERRVDLGTGWATLLASVVGGVAAVVTTWMRTRRRDT